MSYSGIREHPNGTYEKLTISTVHQNDKYISSFSYVDSLSGFQYSSTVFIQKNEWAAVKMAVIHAEKYLKTNKVKNCFYFIQQIWEEFFSHKHHEDTEAK